jgi:hypothetical protein
VTWRAGHDADGGGRAWNPLAETGTDLATARRLADDATLGVRLALREVEWTNAILAHRLLVHELDRAVGHAFAHAEPDTGTLRGSSAAWSPAAARRPACSAPARSAAATPVRTRGPAGAGGLVPREQRWRGRRRRRRVRQLLRRLLGLRLRLLRLLSAAPQLTRGRACGASF